MKDKIIIPERLQNVIVKEKGYDIIVQLTKTRIEELIHNNRHYFFSEYTDHGIEHINQVLRKSDEIIPEHSISLLDSKNVSILVIAIFLHDIGMNFPLDSFNNLMSYDQIELHSIDNKTWKDLWIEYINEARKWDNFQKINIVGQSLNIESLIKEDYSSNTINEYDKKFIGEFLRRHHPRLAHNIAINGLITRNGFIKIIDTEMLTSSLGGIELTHSFEELCGLVARSHGMDLRFFEDFLPKHLDDENWMDFNGIKTIYLMSIIRIADYLLIDSKRISTSIYIQWFGKKSSNKYVKKINA